MLPKESIDFYKHWHKVMYHENTYYELGLPKRVVRDADGPFKLCQFVERNDQISDIYHTLFSYRHMERGDYKRPDYDSFIFDKLVIDIDYDYDLSDRDLKKLYEVHLFFKSQGWNHQIFFTGGRGVHFYFFLGKCLTLDNYYYVISRLKNAIDKHVNFDKIAFNSKAQMIRIPNTQHTKTGLYCVPIKPFHLLSGIDELQERCKNPVWEYRVPSQHNPNLENLLQHLDTGYTKKTSKPKPTNSGSCGFDLTQNVQKGKRDLMLGFIVLSLKQQGVSQKEAMQYLKEWNQNNKPPLPFNHLQYKLNYFYKGRSRVDRCWFASQVFGQHCSECPWMR